MACNRLCMRSHRLGTGCSVSGRGRRYFCENVYCMSDSETEEGSQLPNGYNRKNTQKSRVPAIMNILKRMKLTPKGMYWIQWAVCSLQFSTSTYYTLASNIKQLAKDICEYNLDSLSYSVANTFRAFLGEPSLASEFDDLAVLDKEPSAKVKKAIQRAKSIHSL